MGEHQAARELDEDTLARRRVLGEDHLETLLAANNLSESLRILGEYQVLGEYQAAREPDQAARPGMRVQPGEPRPLPAAAERAKPPPAFSAPDQPSTPAPPGHGYDAPLQPKAPRHRVIGPRPLV